MLRHSTYLFLASFAALTLLATNQPFYEILYFNAAQVSEGQLWRAFTAWLVQANVEHWLVNLWGLIVMAIVLPKQLSREDWLAFTSIWLLSSLCLWLSSYQAYVGLSGVLYGLLFWSIARSPFYGSRIKIAVLAIIIAKVIIENSSLPWFKEAWLSQWIGSEIAHESHVWGLGSGLITYFAYWLIQRFPLNGEPRD
ncbi:rhombosortase [Reinekea sp.]|jgi:rhomboid family GlyGly-CTERM serine protease|uniref:rhombosortase n=1 Tax=Reinekea sp. TaxID=1970455 RepID=UPI00398A0BBF